MAKGGKWERDVARDITEMLTGERNPPALWRSTGSGGWQHRALPDIGDLRPVSEEGMEFRKHFAIECKHQKQRQYLLQILSRQKTALVIQWWTKHYDECVRHDVCPLLVMKADRYPPLVCAPFGVVPPSDNFAMVITMGDITTSGIEPFTISLWSDFREVSMEHLYNEAKQWIGLKKMHKRLLGE